uniref:Endo-1,4-beta-xylanase n=1 Tax=Caldicoprobacter sp. TaxID=2004500 RepID=A0A2L1GH36_9FIRM|nr:endo-beta-1,4-xylanase [Caldicoprobacter sp.]
MGVYKMKGDRLLKVLLAVLMCLVIGNPFYAQAAITLTSNATGTYDGYYYELWKDYGNATMTIDTGGRFSCQWSNVNDVLFRTGKKLNTPWNQLGTVRITYSAIYNPNGNSYLCIYGWSTNPLVEFYIVESWGTWRPPGATSLGTVTIDGGTYDIYRTTRVNQPSIVGTATFYQYWSVRTSKRTSGTVTVTDHFRAWAAKGLNLGTIDQITLCVEGYQNSGYANMTQHTFTIGSSSGSTPIPTPTPTPTPAPTSTSIPAFTTTRVECENMSLSGPYASRITNPVNGIALYANGDRATTNINFAASGNYTFKLRGCGNNNNLASVDLLIDGRKVGSFYYQGTYPWEAPIQNVYVSAGSHRVEIVVSADNGTWDVYADYLLIQ